MPAGTSSAPHVRPQSAIDPARISLRFGESILEVVPELGGIIARYAGSLAGRQMDWMRPAAPNDLARRDPEAASCFPLVPFSNRVRDGRFVFDGIEANIAPLPGLHAEHGHGWRRPWSIDSRGNDRLSIVLELRDAGWPFPYDARQTFRLSKRGLSVELTLTNRSTRDMPAGIGLHPYFPRTPLCRLTACVDSMWQTDAEVMPTRLARPPEHADPNDGIALDRVSLDNCFTGWSGEATIEWPERAASLRMAADEPLRHLVLYTPPGEPYFCAEPVSHCTDAFNLAASGRTDTGTIRLAPGRTMSATVTFEPIPMPAH
jgi:aldose 1-epimerase